MFSAPTRLRSEAGATDARGGRGAMFARRGRGGRGAGGRRRAPASPWRHPSTHTTRADIMIWRQNTGRKDCQGTTDLLSTSDPHPTTIPDQMIDSKLALTELDDDLLKY
ncbi:unnamed protein product [Pieris brassicae]|uniref:Uncharacterized protein n=1 Tax=Pieris brassicae TaxID=7116 RepID=A0A9P0SNV2_PIEBR|nr:unnamed protein product [Pieris brassicae]